jgi:MFS family permease
LRDTVRTDYGAVLRLSDRWGRRTLYIGAVLSAALAIPLFSLIETKDALTITLTMIVAMRVAHATMYWPQAAAVANLPNALTNIVLIFAEPLGRPDGQPECPFLYCKFFGGLP